MALSLQSLDSQRLWRQEQEEAAAVGALAGHQRELGKQARRVMAGLDWSPVLC